MRRTEESPFSPLIFRGAFYHPPTNISTKEALKLSQQIERTPGLEAKVREERGPQKPFPKSVENRRRMKKGDRFGDLSA